MRRRIKKLLKKYTFLTWENKYEKFSIYKSQNHQAKGTIVIHRTTKATKREEYFFDPPNKFIDIKSVIEDLEYKHKASKKVYELHVNKEG